MNNPRRHDEFECTRCGHREFIRHRGNFRDADYIALLHEYFALEAELKAIRRLLLRAQVEHGKTLDSLENSNFLISHLEPLALKHLEILAALAPEAKPALAPAPF